MARTRVRYWSLMVWAETVKQEGGYRCCICGSTENLEAHHVFSLAEYVELQYIPWNGKVLCSTHHRWVHEGGSLQNRLWQAELSPLLGEHVQDNLQEVPTVSEETFAITMLPIKDIQPHPENKRTHTARQLVHLKARFLAHGWYKNVVVSLWDGAYTYLAGHGISEGAFLAGETMAPCHIREIDPNSPEAISILIGDNTSDYYAEDDDEGTREMLLRLEAEDMLLGSGVDPDDDWLRGAGGDGNTDGSEPAKDISEPTIPFTEELLECHNYVVLFFDKDVDWLQAVTLLGDMIGTRRALHVNGRFKGGGAGVGRVLRGPEAIRRLQEGVPWNSTSE